MASKTVERPLDLIRLSLDERVVVKMKGDRILRGKLHVSTCVVDVACLCALNDDLAFPLIPPLNLPPLRQAFDEHINLVLGDVEETYTSTETDPETGENITKSSTRSMEMLFVRGDTIILVSPPVRTG